MLPEAAVLLGRGPALLERAVGYTRGCLVLVADADPHAATPCARWDLAGLLAHMDDSLAAFTEAAELGRVALPGTSASSGPAAGSDGVGATILSLKRRACALLAAWSTDAVPSVRIGARTLDADLLAAVGSLEIAVHGWDVSAACGTPRPIPEALAGTLLAVADLLLEDGDEDRFAQAVDVPEGADAGTRLLARLGRTA